MPIVWKKRKKCFPLVVYINQSNKRIRMKALNTVVISLLVVGGLNWGLLGIWQFDLVNQVCGETLARIVYAIVGLAAVSKIVLWGMESTTE